MHKMKWLFLCLGVFLLLSPIAWAEEESYYITEETTFGDVAEKTISEEDYEALPEEIKEDLDTTYVMSNPPRLQIAVDGEVVLAIGDGTNHTSVGLNFSRQEIFALQLICISIVVIITILIVKRNYYVKK